MAEKSERSVVEPQEEVARVTDRDSTAPRTGAPRLTDEQVRAIAESIAAGERHTTIAQRFGVSVESIGAIKSGKRRADALDDDLRERMRTASPGGMALDADSARAVMVALEAGRAGAEIAAEFGISASMVSAIKHGRAWAELDPELPSRLAATSRRGKALTAEQVVAIRERLATGKSSRKVAAEFGVSASTVLAIARGATWADA
ncbi:MAG: hypothetical protein HGB10_09975 [Coriobacteriia bacterium]|nr:hypothetical protein [Coriobacteriia bacterium]